MLKIKDNVDLKELEKYGFKYKEFVNDISVDEWYKDLWVDEKGNKIEPPKLNKTDINWAIYENDEGNELSVCVFDLTSEQTMKPNEIIADDVINVDILYDLITNGLVEKVSD